MIFREKFEPFAEIGNNIVFAGGSANKLNKSVPNGYEIETITPFPEYFLQFIGNTLASPVISSIISGANVVYNGTDLQLEDNQLLQMRFNVMTSNLQVGIQYGKSGKSIYGLKQIVAFVDMNLASTLYELTEFYAIGNTYPAWSLANIGPSGSTITSAYITIAGYIFTLNPLSSPPSKKSVVPLWPQ